MTGGMETLRIVTRLPVYTATQAILARASKDVIFHADRGNGASI